MQFTSEFIAVVGAAMAFFASVSAAPKPWMVEPAFRPSKKANHTVVAHFDHIAATLLNETQPEFAKSIKHCGLIEKCIRKKVLEASDKLDNDVIVATIKELDIKRKNRTQTIDEFKNQFEHIISDLHDEELKIAKDCGRNLKTPKCIMNSPLVLSAELEKQSRIAAEYSRGKDVDDVL